MEQYISKSALVAEIKRRIDENRGKQSLPQYFGMIEEDLNILSFIDTLEVKEIGVDFGDPKGDKSVKCIIETKTIEVKETNLEKEIDFAMPSKYCWSGDGEAVYSKEQMRNFAKHFFGLGLKARK